MLTAARTLRHEGKDVIVGLLETHGRKETEALLQGLEILPRAEIAYQGRTLPEFDIDAALARHPALILVDELAHTNVPGSRHPKRWQDIDELLDAGMDVYTTLNVQHIESLHDVVGGITGITVWETVPDFFFDQADEVVLVDVSADDLLARLSAGKVYLPEQIERAASTPRATYGAANRAGARPTALRKTSRLTDPTNRSSVSGRPRIHYCAASGPEQAARTWCATQPGSPHSWASAGPRFTSKRQPCSGFRRRSASEF